MFHYKFSIFLWFMDILVYFKNMGEHLSNKTKCQSRFYLQNVLLSLLLFFLLFFIELYIKSTQCFHSALSHLTRSRCQITFTSGCRNNGTSSVVTL